MQKHSDSSEIFGTSREIEALGKLIPVLRLFMPSACAALVMAMVMPAIYAGVVNKEAVNTHLIFAVGLLIILPVLVSKTAVRRTDSFPVFFFLSLSAAALATGLAWYIVRTASAAVFQAADPQVRSGLSIATVVVFVIESVIMIYDSYLIRRNLQKRKLAREQNDVSWRASVQMFERPSFAWLVWFILIYLYGINIVCPALADEALFCAFLILLMTAVDRFLDKTGEYLRLNSEVANVPGRRILKIGAAMLAVVLLLSVLMAVPAYLTRSLRSYRNIRDASFGNPVTMEEIMQINEEMQGGYVENPFAELAGEEEYTPPPEWLNTLAKVLEIGIFAGLAVFIVLKVKGELSHFREEADDNGDIIENLDDEDVAESLRKVRRFGKPDVEGVRLLYKKTIRRHRKELPARWESPAEIEEKAGLRHDPEMKTLHGEYEKERYGR